MNKDYLQHYYKDDQKELLNRKEITFRFLDLDYFFTTADNVFSKDHVDFGTELLLNSSIEEGINSKVLDYGCGYGVVGTVLSKLNFDVIGLDVTDRALKLSYINNKRNNTNFKVYKVEDNLSIYDKMFQTILLNPPIRAGKAVIYEMFQNAYNFLDDKGVLFIVIKKQHGAKSAQKQLSLIFDKVSVIAKSKGYYVIKSTKH